MSSNSSKSLFSEENTVKPKGPVECLGITFENDEKRREHFLEILKEKLKDPEFRKIEGFPIGEDEDILALSDPPYYTACPNPWIGDFVKLWESQKPPSNGKPYHREPFAADVSEGKNDPIYNAHSYHTKVPHKAIMRYILHYTEPGDIVFDGFCGTGMTGVAAQMCGDRITVQSLGYQVLEDGTIKQEEIDEEGNKIWRNFSKLGARKAVLNDLSPAATFIAYNYNTPVDVIEFEREAKRILAEVEKECGWMYETRHADGRKGRINYTIWSDVFICPECSGEVVFWEVAVDKKVGKVLDEFPCPHCSTLLTKRKMGRAWIAKLDSALGDSIRHTKRVPVLLNYSLHGEKKRYTKIPDDFDQTLINRIEILKIPYFFPVTKIPKGDKTGEPLRIGIANAHHFYSKRNLWVLGALWESLEYVRLGRMLITSVLIKTASLLHNIGFKNGNINLAGALPNALYIPSNLAERNIFQLVTGKVSDFTRAGLDRMISHQISETISLGSKHFEHHLHNSLDYIFLDPPFGSNLQYSELNFLWESWLRVVTNNDSEAIESRSQGKNIEDYRRMMTNCFKQAFRILKPGRWMTVEFSNTKALVWNTLQSSLVEAGFVVANVAALNKGQGTFNSQTNPTSVKQDLVISAYKPNGGFEERFILEAQTEQGVWDFVRTHMKYLPVFKSKNGKLVPISERDSRILFDQVVSYFVRKGFNVPISSQEFQQGLAESFVLRDEMYFLPEQVVEYDKKRLRVKEAVQLNLFVCDEASAIQWLKQELMAKPRTYQDIHPIFMQELAGWQRHEKGLELGELLSQNFIQYDGKDEVPSQIHSYLSTYYKELRNLNKDDPSLVLKAKDRWYAPDPKKSGDLEKVRERALLKEFKEYVEFKKKRLKVFRLEAVRAGFKKAWQDRDYATIIAVAEKIPEKILQEDPKLLMWYDQAVTRMGEDI